jgi:pimeloyl-ACP methyl ester carboxylesterase
MRIRRLTAAVATVLLTVTGAAGTSSAAATHQPKPTIVLVHGAFADGGSWSEVTKKLQRDGYTVVSPAVPLRGIASDTSYLKGVLAGISGPKVLVGHSYGGALITQLAGAATDVKSLVYVAAFVPQAGETIGALNAQFPGSEINETTTNTITYPGGVDLIMKPDAFRWVFAADLPSRQAAVLASSQRPVAASVFTETVPASAPAGLPKYAVVAGKDRAIAPAAERFMAKRANAKVVEAPGASHLVMLSEPSLVTHTIEQAAR